MRRLLKASYIVPAVVLLSATGINRYWHPPTPLQPIYPAYFGNRLNIPGNNPMTEEGVRLGRMLFYETSLSANNRFSCASCHRQELAFTDGKKFSPGFDGTPTERSSMSLVNLLWVRNFFWDGRAASLEMQAETPLTNPHEMGQSLEAASKKLQQTKMYPILFGAAFGSDTISGEKIVKALAQFERTLISANSTYDKYLRGEYQPTASEMNGIHLFFGEGMAGQMARTAGCGHCHGGPKTFLDQYHNNGLDSMVRDSGREKITGLVYDRGRFRVATLRNIALTAPYMHDGRFNTLEEVVDHYSDHIQPGPTLSPTLQINDGRGLRLSVQEKKDLLSFLRMLTDSSFITDKRFSNPFVKK